MTLRTTSGRGWRAALAAASALAVTLMSAPPATAAPAASQWHLDYLKVRQAHAITTGKGVTVAVIDTGVDPKHPDLTGAVLKGNDFALPPASPPDGRTDNDGHGTSMAGLIAGQGRGPDRLLGIAPGAKILPVRHQDKTDYTSFTDTAIEWAAAQGAKVISMSFSDPEHDADSERTIEAARRADVVLVAGVGNTPKSRSVEYPAAYPGVIAVGGVDRHGNHAKVSVTGPEVDIVAPAEDITNAELHGKASNGSGTSIATAIVAGAAALVRARYPDLTADEVAYRLIATATDNGPKGHDSTYGHGILNIHAALTADLPPMPADFPDPLPDGPTPGAAAPEGPTGYQPQPISPPASGIPIVPILLAAAGLLILASAAAGLFWWRTRRR